MLRRALADAERGLGAAAARRWTTTRSPSWPHASDGDARTALNVLEMAVDDRRAGRGRARSRWTWPAMQRGLRAQGAPLRQGRRGALQHHQRAAQVDPQLRRRRRRSTGWRACWRRARTRSTSRGGSCASPPRTWAWPIRRRWSLAMAAQQAVHFIGMPEGALALAQAAVYLAAAPEEQRRSTPRTARRARGRAATTRAEPVPLWIRNAPTPLMKQLGYGKGYRYAHDEAEGVGGDGLPARRARAAAGTTGPRRAARKPRRRRGWRRRAASGSGRGRRSRRQGTDLLLHWRRDGLSRYNLWAGRPSSIPAMAKKKKILAVDDDATALGALRQILVQKGYEVSTAPNGARRADRARQRHLRPRASSTSPCPGSAATTCAARSARTTSTRDLPVIFLTAKGMLVDMTRGRGGGERSLPGQARPRDQALEHGRHVPLRRHAPGQEAPLRPHEG